MNSRSFAVVISLLVFSFTLVFCGNKKDNNTLDPDLINNPVTADGKGNKNKLPKFDFEKESHDFGKVIEGEIVTYTFMFTNTGGSDLLINKAEASCGCTNLQYPKKPIRAGEEGEITVSFNSDRRRGVNNKKITLVANTQPSTKVLYIKALVVKP